MLTPVSPNVSPGILNSSATATNTVDAGTTRTESRGETQTGVTPSAVFIRSERYQALEKASAVESSGDVSKASAPLSDSAARIQETTNTILGFIEAQLQRDIENGATADELASRLQAGLDGVKQGFAQASQQLEEMGLMTAELNAELQLTFDSLVAGSENLQEQFVEGGNTAKNVASDIDVNQSFGFSLTTKDGVTSDIQVMSLQQGVSRSILDQLKGVEALLDYSETSERYALTASEPLSDTVLESARDLLNQFADLSERFQQDGGSEAYQSAQSLGYDSSKISQFVQGANQSAAHRVQQTYGQIQSQAGDVNQSVSANLGDSLKPLISFAQGLQQTLEPATDFQGAEELLVRFSEVFDGGDAGLKQITASLLSDRN